MQTTRPTSMKQPVRQDGIFTPEREGEAALRPREGWATSTSSSSSSWAVKRRSHSGQRTFVPRAADLTRSSASQWGQVIEGIGGLPGLGVLGDRDSLGEALAGE